MNGPTAATAMDALGHEVRLDAFRALVRAGNRGLSIAELQRSLGDVPRSTLAHHLHKLLQAGLVSQEKRGAAVFSRARFDVMDALVAYLTDECCVDEPGRATAHARVAPVLVR